MSIGGCHILVNQSLGEGLSSTHLPWQASSSVPPAYPVNVSPAGKAVKPRQPRMRPPTKQQSGGLRAPRVSCPVDRDGPGFLRILPSFWRLDPSFRSFCMDEFEHGLFPAGQSRLIPCAFGLIPWLPKSIRTLPIWERRWAAHRVCSGEHCRSPQSYTPTNTMAPPARLTAALALFAAAAVAPRGARGQQQLTPCDRHARSRLLQLF